MAEPNAEQLAGLVPLLEQMILGGPAVYTQAEISEKSGVPKELGQRIWQALGFAIPPEDTIAFTEQDAQALRDIRTMLASDLVDEEMVLHLSRGVGQTMGRLADWVGGAFIQRAAERLLDPGQPLTDETVAEVINGTEELLPLLSKVLVRGWQRQLTATAVRILESTATSTADPAAGTAHLAIGFADIVSFTRLSRQLDTEGLGSLIERFEVAASQICAEVGGRIVKSLGDEVLFYSEDPLAAAEIGLRLAERADLDEGFPRLRVGLAYGQVINRLGDVFGTPVNLAARLTAIGQPDSVLADGALAEAVSGQYHTLGLKARPLQGLGRVRPWVIRRTPSESARSADRSSGHHRRRAARRLSR